ncbi:MAG: hypothetical protein AAFZ15_08880 [Bacteroidota bacterium]
MKKTKRVLLALLGLVVAPQLLWNQTMVFVGSIGSTGPKYIFQIDLATCEFCIVSEATFGPTVDGILTLPDGNVIVSENGFNQVFDPPNPVPIATINENWEAAIIHPNGNIYVSNGPSLLLFDPITNTTTFIGSFPPPLGIDAFYFVGNTLYGLGYEGPGTRPIYEIDINDPSASTQIIPFINDINDSATLPNGDVIVTDKGGGITQQTDFILFDPVTYDTTFLCEDPDLFVYAISALPAGAPPSPCICFPNSAGTPATSTVLRCAPLGYTAIFNNDALLDYNDIVQYILYTDPNNPLTSILIQSNSPFFPFEPPLQLGVTYYIARVVGDEVNGQVDLTDDCTDVSPPIAITWNPEPELLSITSGSAGLCPGKCEDITLEVSGTPPFSFNYEVVQGGTVISPLTTVSGQSTNTITYEVCLPVGTGNGPVEIIICRLVDAFCVNVP